MKIFSKYNLLLDNAREMGGEGGDLPVNKKY